MENEAFLIRNRMTETRTAMSEKLEALEAKLSETVKDTTEAVTETASAVAETVSSVKDSVQNTVEAVQSAFDVNQLAENHPWLLVGGSVLVGYLVGASLSGPSLPEPAYTPSPTPTPPPSAPEPQSRRSSLWESWGLESLVNDWYAKLKQAVTPAIEKFQDAAMGAIGGAAANVVSEMVPQDWREPAGHQHRPA